MKAIAERRFPTYLTPIKYVTDGILEDIVPSPPDIQLLAKVFTHISTALWVKQLRRLTMPRPCKSASIKTAGEDSKHPKSKGRKTSSCSSPGMQEGVTRSSHSSGVNRRSTHRTVPCHSFLPTVLAANASELDCLPIRLSDQSSCFSSIAFEGDDQDCQYYCGVEFNLLAKTKQKVSMVEGMAFFVTLFRVYTDKHMW